MCKLVMLVGLSSLHKQNQNIGLMYCLIHLHQQDGKTCSQHDGVRIRLFSSALKQWLKPDLKSESCRCESPAHLITLITARFLYLLACGTFEMTFFVLKNVSPTRYRRTCSKSSFLECHRTLQVSAPFLSFVLFLVLPQCEV